MAETTEKKVEGFVDPAKNNEEVARKLANQDTTNRPTNPGDYQDASSALDALAKAAEEAPKEKPEVEAKPSAAESEKTEAELAELAKKAEELRLQNESDLKRAGELFKGTPDLPTGASPKSTEAFSTIKIRAAQEIAARETEIEKLNKKVQEYEAKLKDPVPPELTKELNDHRTWRAKIDIEADPKFKEFDKAVSSAQEFIYAQLKKSPAITDETIEQIKKYGGPENVNLEKIFGAVKDPTLQRLIESKVADIEMAKYNKEQAIKSAKDNVGQYLKDREEQFQKSTTAHNEDTRKHLNDLVAKLDWMKPKEIDPKADAAGKAATEAHNKFIDEAKGHLEVALKDDSAEMRAIMLTGMAQLFYVQKIQEQTSARATLLEKENAELKEKLDKLKKASVSRLNESNAPPGTKPTEIKKDNFNVRAGDALDAAAKQIMEERERARSGQ